MKQHDDSGPPVPGALEGRADRGARARVAHPLSAWSGWLVDWARKHRGGLRRWGGLGSLAAGIGLMAGGLDPIGFSLILVGTAVLLAELERTGQSGPNQNRK